MRGQVLKADGLDGPGLILGDDGARYSYTQGQVRGGNALAPGQQVDFISLGEEARDIYALGPAPAADPASAQAAPPPSQPAPRPMAVPTPGPSPMPVYGGQIGQRGDGVWTYFIRSITRNYFNFTGRARRQEYWGYTLFNLLTYVVVFTLDIILSAAFYGTDSYGDPNFAAILTLLWFLYQTIPSIAVTVRRLHDRDLSGWLYLIGYVPYIGWLVLFVFLVLDSLPARNSHGISPKYGQGLEAEYAFS
jgi:uncharacterized membrane protein YhaH (DUF805 family)